MFKHTSLLLLAAVPAFVHAQALPPVDEQIAAAVLPLPAEMRAGATVMGYKTAGKLETIRPGTNGMNCLALYVVRENFHVACYHQGLEQFMARGREIRAAGTPENRVDTVRFAEIKAGKIKMPVAGALYTLTGPKTAWDPRTGKATGANALFVVYMPYATTATTGITSAMVKGTPFLMYPGTEKAHVMIMGSMQ